MLTRTSYLAVMGLVVASSVWGASSALAASSAVATGVGGAGGKPGAVPPAAATARGAAAPQAASVPKRIFKKSESHQFSGSRLKGKLKKPELSYIYQRKGLRSEKIVNVPENFNEEINDGASQF